MAIRPPSMGRIAMITMRGPLASGSRASNTLAYVKSFFDSVNDFGTGARG